jgi:hypothetical protein
MRQQVVRTTETAVRAKRTIDINTTQPSLSVGVPFSRGTTDSVTARSCSNPSSAPSSYAMYTMYLSPYLHTRCAHRPPASAADAARMPSSFTHEPESCRTIASLFTHVPWNGCFSCAGLRKLWQQTEAGLTIELSGYRPGKLAASRPGKRGSGNGLKILDQGALVECNTYPPATNYSEDRTLWRVP